MKGERKEREIQRKEFLTEGFPVKILSSAGVLPEITGLERKNRFFSK